MTTQDVHVAVVDREVRLVCRNALMRDVSLVKNGCAAGFRKRLPGHGRLWFLTVVPEVGNLLHQLHDKVSKGAPDHGHEKGVAVGQGLWCNQRN